MNGYIIDFQKTQNALEELTQTVNHLTELLHSLELAVNDGSESSLFPNSIWKGPKKNAYMASLKEYYASLNGLSSAAQQHVEVLQEVLKRYINVEND